MRAFQRSAWARIAIVALAMVLPVGLAAPSVSAEELDGVSLKDVKELLSKLEPGENTAVDKHCGLSCLYLFLKLHGVNAKFSHIQELVPLDEHGASLQALADASQKLGLRALPVGCAPADVSKLPLPAIAHVERFREDKPYLHYVIITKAEQSGISVFDPFDNDIHYYNRSQMGAILSGHFVVAVASPLTSRGAILGVAGLMCACIGLWQIVRAWWRRARLRGSERRLLHDGIVCAFVAFCCCLPGCGRAVPENSSPNNGKAEAVAPIEAEKTNLDVGPLPAKSVAKGEFHFRNKTTSPLALRLGAADCSCLKAELQKDVLAPGEAGSLVLQLDTTDRQEGGEIQGCVLLFAGDHDPLRFCVKGLLDGILFPQRYVIRPAHYRKQAIPHLQFNVVTHKLLDCKITKVTCVAVADFRNVLLKEGDPAYTLKTPSPVTAELSKVTISPPMYQARDGMYVRQVNMPMRQDGPPRAYSGKIIVDYVLGQEKLQATTGLLALGVDDD